MPLTPRHSLLPGERAALSSFAEMPGNLQRLEDDQAETFPVILAPTRRSHGSILQTQSLRLPLNWLTMTRFCAKNNWADGNTGCLIKCINYYMLINVLKLCWTTTSSSFNTVHKSRTHFISTLLWYLMHPIRQIVHFYISIEWGK